MGLSTSLFTLTSPLARRSGTLSVEAASRVVAAAFVIMFAKDVIAFNTIVIVFSLLHRSPLSDGLRAVIPE